MRPSGHVHSTTIALALLFGFMHSFTQLQGFLFLLGSLLLDNDYHISKRIFKQANHRDFITHSILFYLILIPLCFLGHLEIIWLFIGAFFHLSFDLLDWGLPLLPFRPNTYITPHLLTVPSQIDEIYFFKTYFGNKIILLVEIVLFIGLILSLAFLPLNLLILVLMVETLVLAEFLFQLTKSKSLTK